MTRTTKANDPPHNDPEAMALMQENQLPRFYGKVKDVETAPGKTKKDGGGRGNWGHAGDETEDMEFSFNKTRRRSNSNSANLELKTKFEINEAEPVFEEELHGAPPPAHEDEDGEALSTSSTNDSTISSAGISSATGGTLSS